MFVEKFIKKYFVSFYKDEKYFFLLEVKKNKKTLKSEKKEFDKKEEFEKEVKEILEDYTPVYISTILTSINQGAVPSCLKSEYKKRNIDIENTKFICIKNYSFYTSIYEIASIKKKYSFEIDFLYSIFAPIDYFAKKRDNYFYVLILKERIAILGYKNEVPIFSEVIELKHSVEDETEDEIEPIEDDVDMLDDIDIEIEEEDLSENIEEEAENLDIEESPESKLELSSTEKDIIDHLQNSIKEYYQDYSDDFLEKIVFLDTIEIGDNIKKLTEDELFIESEIVKFDLLSTINKLSELENV